MTRKFGASKRRRGIATIVGITIFLALFAMTIAFTFEWEQNTQNYVSATSKMVATDKAGVSESLTLDIVNSTFLRIENPTSQASVVNYIMSNNTVWTVNTEIPPFGNCSFGPFPSADGNFRVTTVKGNLYTGSVDSQLEDLASHTWHVQWYVGNSTPISLSDLTSDQQIGESYWYKLSMDWLYGTGYSVVGNYSFAANQTIGFVASANLVKLSDNNSAASINYMIDNSSRIAFVIDGVPQDPLGLGNYWYDSTDFAWYTLNGPLNSNHTVEVYFYGYGNNSQELSLNVVNAKFYPYISSNISGGNISGPLSIYCTAIYQNSSSRVNNGSTVSISYYLVWSSNSSTVASGTLSINGTSRPILGGWCNFTVTSSAVTKNTYAETSVNSGGCTLYYQMPPNPSVIWDRLNITYVSNGTSIHVGQTAQITINATYEYDNSPASLIVNTLRNGTHYATGNFSDYETGAVVYTYSLENFTDIVNGLTAYDSSPLTVKWNLAPAGVVAYFPITLTNNQASATATNFQQQLFINWSLYSPYANSSLSNIVFFDNSGNLLYAWDENGTTNATNSLTTVWVNLGSNTIAANSNLTIYIGFDPLNYENRSPTGYWGMFPNATSVYAQYDNGKNVFIFYDNFAGTSISSAWNTVGAIGDYSVNNSLFIYPYPVTGAAFTLLNNYTGPIAIDALQWYKASLSSSDEMGVSFCNFQTNISTSLTPTSGAYQVITSSTQYVYYPSSSVSNASSPTTTVPQVTTLVCFSNMAAAYQNYRNKVSITTSLSTTNYVGIDTIAGSSSSIIQVSWIRVRTPPPNNVMPSVSFGGLILP